MARRGKKDTSATVTVEPNGDVTVPAEVIDTLGEAVDMEQVTTDEQAEEIVSEASLLPVKVGMVSLAEQDAQIAALEGVVVESSGDAAVVGKPWDNWDLPETVDCELGHVRVHPDNANKRLLLEVPGYDPAPFGETIWKNLDWSGDFPATFVRKLSAETAALVINERLQTFPKRPLRAIREGGRWLSLVPARRDFVPAKRLAETAWDAFSQYGIADLLPDTPEEPWYDEGSMLLRFLSPKRFEVTRRRGDVIRMGVEIGQTYGSGIDLSLYVERLVCINGMIAGHREIAFKGAVMEVTAQLDWVRERIAALPEVFDRLALSATAMAGRRLGENVLVPEALANYARNNGLQARLVPLARRAWDEMLREEEDVQPTEWDLSNAFTRALRDVQGDARWDRETRFAQMNRVGEWVRGDEIVRALLRRRDAERVHAQIEETVAN